MNKQIHDSTNHSGCHSGAQRQSELGELNFSAEAKQYSRRGVLKWITYSGAAMTGAGGLVGLAYRQGLIAPIQSVDHALAANGWALNNRGKRLIPLYEQNKLDRQTIKRTYDSGLTLLPVELNRISVRSAWLNYLQSDVAAEVKSFTEMERDIFEPFLAQLRQELKSKKGRTSLALDAEGIVALKQAFDVVLVQAFYNEAKRSMFHALVPDQNGVVRAQCDGGSKLFVAAAREILTPDNNAKLVYVYTKGHRLAGLMRSDQSIIGLETTVLGGTVIFSIKNIPPGLHLRVTEAAFEDQMALLPVDKLNLSKGLIFDNVPKTAGSLGKGRFGYGFGHVNTPAGDMRRSDVAQLKLENYFEPQQAFGLQPVAASRKGTGSGGVTTQGLDLHKLESTLSAAEYRTVKSYLDYTAEMLEFYNLHVMIVNGESLSAAQKAREILAVVEQMRAYMRAHDLVSQYQQAQAILDKYGLKFLDDMHPAAVHDIVVSNYNVLAGR